MGWLGIDVVSQDFGREERTEYRCAKGFLQGTCKGNELVGVARNLSPGKDVTSSPDMV